ncbi:hypothetical protein [Paraburkholderia heleia]|uniref:hypothetical protein n=1 Tax=Paraburkholderia heleia TaxID=634127 RepID=UPI002AB7C41C|nr:hypothetical protein [Paraburkholderia heleia]
MNRRKAYLMVSISWLALFGTSQAWAIVEGEFIDEHIGTESHLSEESIEMSVTHLSTEASESTSSVREGITSTVRSAELGTTSGPVDLTTERALAEATATAESGVGSVEAPAVPGVPVVGPGSADAGAGSLAKSASATSLGAAATDLQRASAENGTLQANTAPPLSRSATSQDVLAAPLAGPTDTAAPLRSGFLFDEAESNFRGKSSNEHMREESHSTLADLDQRSSVQVPDTLNTHTKLSIGMGENVKGSERSSLANPEFNWDRGDLIYGLDDERTSFQNKKLAGKEYDYGFASIIDSINQARLNAGRSPDHFGDARKDYESQFRDLGIDISGRLKVIDSLMKLGSENQKYDTNQLFSRFDNQAICRACKEGIRSALLDDADHHIHFVLDGIDQNAVALKRGFEGNSVTASELRAAYRLRSTPNFSQKVHFYKTDLQTQSYRQVQEPWSASPKRWAAYERARSIASVAGRR